MSNKFVLHGGGSTNRIDCLRDKSSVNKKVLLVYHAKSNISMRQASFNKDLKLLVKSGFLKKDISQGAESINLLLKQIESSEVIIIKGGDSSILSSRLNGLKDDIGLYLKNKTVIGISAGAYRLSKKYYSNDRCNIFEGAGIIKANVICHYKENLYDYYITLSKTNTPVYCIREGESIIIYQ